MHNQSLISVIIPTYNRKLKIGYAIESVLRQTYTNVQLIVADDGSTDDTSLFLKNYSSVEYINLPHGGQGWARSQGLLHARGKYIASLDSDDVWNDDFLEKCVDMIERYHLDFVFTNWMQEIENGELVERFSICENLKMVLEEYSDEWIMLGNKRLREIYLKGCPSPSSSMVMKRSSMQTNWNVDMRIADDWRMQMEMIFNKSCRAAVTREVLWSKYLDGQNIYDGKEIIDINSDLWVHDIDIIFKNLRHLLSKKEVKIFKKNQVRYLLQHAYCQFNIYQKYSSSLSILKKAMGINAPLVILLMLKKLSKKTNPKTISIAILHKLRFKKIKPSTLMMKSM